MNVHEVSASYLFRQDGQMYERTLSILFLADSRQDAVLAGLRWGKNRAEALEWGMPVCIKIHPFSIDEPGLHGYISSGRGFPCFEWKYDTSPLSFEKLLEFHTPITEGVHRG